VQRRHRITWNLPMHWIAIQQWLSATLLRTMANVRQMESDNEEALIALTGLVLENVPRDLLCMAMKKWATNTKIRLFVREKMRFNYIALPVGLNENPIVSQSLRPTEQLERFSNISLPGTVKCVNVCNNSKKTLLIVSGGYGAINCFGSFCIYVFVSQRRRQRTTKKLVSNYEING